MTAVIRIAGVDVTSVIDIARTRFQMNAGPDPGPAEIWVRDLGHNHTYTVGKEATLDIDGHRVWGGYVMGVHRKYAFDADDTSDAALTPRYFVLDCSDYNILFNKRFVFNVAEPTASTISYAAGTHDDVIIDDLVTNYLDLTGDGISTSGVVHVGTPMEDSKGQVFQAADRWRDAMRQIALMPGAIYFIDADKTLVYADVDVENAPFALSDEPNDTTSFGYSNLEILGDGTNLANEGFVWGTGLGQDHFTFSDYKNNPSIALHGLWQWSDYRADLYKPQSVLKRATTYIEGSVQNNRGHKDPATSIRCTTRKAGLRAGMKVDFSSVVHGFNDIIPIRQIVIHFVNPDEALYELYLAHYLDEAWNTAEFPIPGGGGDTVIPQRLCEVPIYHPGVTVAGCAPEIAANTIDNFNRTVSSDWGTASSGIIWRQTQGLDYVPTEGVSYSVDGSKGVITCTNSSIAFGSIDALVSPDYFVAQARISDYPVGDLFFFMNLGSPGAQSRHYLAFIDVTGTHEFQVHRAGTFTTGHVTRTWDGRPFFVKVEINSTETKAKVWYEGDAEPASYQATTTSTWSRNTGNPSEVAAVCFEGDSMGNGQSIKIDDVQVSTLNGQTLWGDLTCGMWDDFKRTVAPITTFNDTWPAPYNVGTADVWGPASNPGVVWNVGAGVNVSGGGSETISVDGDHGRMYLAHNTVIDQQQSDVTAYIDNPPGLYATSVDWDVSWELLTAKQDLVRTNGVPFWNVQVQTPSVVVDVGLEQGGIFSNSTGPHGQRLTLSIVGDGSGYFQAQPFFMNTGQWYKMRLRWIDSQMLAAFKMWPSDQPQPLSWTAMHVATSKSAPGFKRFSFAMFNGGSEPELIGEDMEMWIRNLGMGGACGSAGNGCVEGGVSTAAYWSVSRAYIPGSLEVTSQGVQVGDTELNPGAGTFLLSGGTVAGGGSGITGGGTAIGFSDWSTKPVFKSYPAASPISMSGRSGFTISAKSFINQVGSNVMSIHLDGCSNFTVTDCDFDTITEPMFFHNCSNFTVSWVRAKNIVGPHARDGSHRGNLIQMDNCVDYTIEDFEAVGGDTEDVISNFQSGGSGPTSYSVIRRGLIDMTGYSSDSGTGIILGDGGSRGYVEVYSIAFKNPGQVAMQIIDGVGHKIHDCVVWSEAVAHSNVGVSSFSGNPTAEIYNMRVLWFKQDGSENPNYFGAGTINEHNNNWHAALTAADIPSASVNDTGGPGAATITTTCVADTFDRSVAFQEHLGAGTSNANIGTSDAGFTYTTELGGNASVSASVGTGPWDDRLVMGLYGDISGSGGQNQVGATTIVSKAFSGEPRSIQFKTDYLGRTGSLDRLLMQFRGVDVGASNANIKVDPHNQTPGGSRIRWTFGDAEGTSIPSTFWVVGTTYTWSITQTGSTMTTAITDGTNTYSTAITTSPTTVNAIGVSAQRALDFPSDPFTWSIYWDNLIIPELCSVTIPDVTGPGSDLIACYKANGTALPPTPLPVTGSGGTGVYRPAFVRQLGWGTSLDGFNCTMASACMALDRHTMGAKTATPPQMRAAQLDQVGGTDLNDVAYAWSHGFGESFTLHTGISWSSFAGFINGGRGAILQGDYSKISNTYSCQPSFDGSHAIYVNEQRANGDWLTYDPLCFGSRWIPDSMLQSYALSFGGGSVQAGFTQVTG